MLEDALTRLVGTPIRVVGAGRTDAGAHATGQVISFRATTALSEATIRRGVNALLPADVAVRDVVEVDEAFHARYSATSRTYNYMIWNAPTPRPLLRRTTLWVDDPLDLEGMERASRVLVGRHDFSAFSALGGEVPRSRERTVRRAEWREGADELLTFEIEADSFLRGMVRGIVGTLLRVGRGRLGAGGFAAVLGGRRRDDAAPAAPARGLCLVRVDYGPKGDGRNEYADEREGEDQQHWE